MHGKCASTDCLQYLVRSIELLRDGYLLVPPDDLWRCDLFMIPFLDDFLLGTLWRTNPPVTSTIRYIAFMDSGAHSFAVKYTAEWWVQVTLGHVGFSHRRSVRPLAQFKLWVFRWPKTARAHISGCDRVSAAFVSRKRTRDP